MAIAAAARQSADAPARRSRSLSAGAEFRFEVVRDLAALDALADSWNALADRCDDARQGFQSFAWLRSWATHYAGDGQELSIVLGYSGGELALIWPLGAYKRFGLRIVRFLGEPLSQYHDVLAEEGEAGDRLVAAALRYIRGLSHDILVLRRVREDSRLVPALLQADARVQRRERAPFIDFGRAANFGAFEAALSSKTRSNRRRRWRQIQQLGEIAVESAASPGRAEELIAIAMGFKREWASKGGHYAPAAFDPRFARCFRDAARGADPHASLRVFALLCDRRPIGVEISFGYRGRLFAHVLAPDPALAKFGLGNALADAAIEDGFERGYRVYDLLAPANPYKAVWTQSSVEVLDFTLAATRRGALAHALGARLFALARELGKRAPGFVVRALLRRAERRGARAAARRN